MRFGFESTGILLMRNDGLGGEFEAGCGEDALASRSARIVVSRTSRNFTLQVGHVTSWQGGISHSFKYACLQARAVVLPLKPIKTEDLRVRAAN